MKHRPAATMYTGRGKRPNIDPFTFVPRYNVQRLLIRLNESKRKELLQNTRSILGCDPATFQRIRMEAKDPALLPEYRRRAARVWPGPTYELMKKIARYFSDALGTHIPMESLENEASEVIIPQPEIKFRDTQSKNQQ